MNVPAKSDAEHRRQWIMLRVLSVGVVLLGLPYLVPYAWMGQVWIAALLCLVMGLVGGVYAWACRSDRPDIAAVGVLGLVTIFVPFTQVHGDLHARYGGMGLSLALSRLLTRQLGGELRVESELGVGSSFRMELPI